MMWAGTAGNRDRVSPALRQPRHLLQLSLQDWELLIRQARSGHLLARIACMVQAQGSFDVIPDAPKAHLEAAMIVAEAQLAEALRELHHIDRALSHTGVRPVLLSGAAYVATGLLPAMGRMFSAIDILVPEGRLPEVEAALLAGGWGTAHHTASDQRYYRQWRHELPPMRHVQRQAEVIIHHAIWRRPRRSISISESLLRRARVLPNLPGFAVLDDTDMALQCMVHLFHDDDLNQGLRELSDLDLLLRHFGRVPAFWPNLLERARELDVSRSLHYGLRFAHELLDTPVPLATLEAANAGGPDRAVSTLSDWLWTRALRPQHSTASGWGTATALFALRTRALSLRLPPLLLMRHLTVRALRARKAPRTANA